MLANGERTSRVHAQHLHSHLQRSAAYSRYPVASSRNGFTGCPKYTPGGSGGWSDGGRWRAAVGGGGWADGGRRPQAGEAHSVWDTSRHTMLAGRPTCSPTHPSPFCFYNFKTPNGVTFPNTTPVQKQGSRTGRQPSRSPRLPTGMGSRTGSMLPITHACAETGFPYGKATFP